MVWCTSNRPGIGVATHGGVWSGQTDCWLQRLVARFRNAVPEVSVAVILMTETLLLQIVQQFDSAGVVHGCAGEIEAACRSRLSQRDWDAGRSCVTHPFGLLLSDQNSQRFFRFFHEFDRAPPGIGSLVKPAYVIPRRIDGQANGDATADRGGCRDSEL